MVESRVPTPQRTPQFGQDLSRVRLPRRRSGVQSTPSSHRAAAGLTPPAYRGLRLTAGESKGHHQRKHGVLFSARSPAFFLTGFHLKPDDAWNPRVLSANFAAHAH